MVKETGLCIKEAKSDYYPYNAVWIVFDKDFHKRINEVFNIANQNKPKIKIAFSNICFEYWVLLHFKKIRRSFQDCKHLISYLEISCKFEYSITMNIYEALKGKSEVALENCMWLLDQNRADLDSRIKPYELDAYTDFDGLYLFIKNTLLQTNRHS